MASKNEDDFWKEDDFWNTSSTSTFNFDDDDDSFLLKTTSDYVFNPTTEESNMLPIHSIISKECLSIVLDDIKSTIEYVVPPVEETIRKMFHGQKFVLQVYHTLDDKLLLLDAAIHTWDGNIIIAVILFLRKSLKTNVFLTHLTKRKRAVKHYANYLTTRNSLQELADLYMATGNTSNMKDVYYIISKDNNNQQSLLKRLNQFVVDHSDNLIIANDKFDIFENIIFIKWQIDNRETCDSVIEQLALLSKKWWEKNKGDEDVVEFKKQFKIDDFQYEWTIMNVLARLGLWKKMISLFIKPNWLTKNVSLKSVIKQDVFVNGLSKHKPPKDVLEQFVQCVTDNDLSFFLAQKLDLHRFIINYYIAQKDRIALLSYKEKVVSLPEDLLALTNALQSPHTKWKN